MKYCPILIISFFLLINAKVSHAQATLTKDELLYFKNLCVAHLENPSYGGNSSMILYRIYSKDNEGISILSVIDSFEAVTNKRKSQDKIFGELCRWSNCKENNLFITLESLGLTGKTLTDFTRYIISKYSNVCQGETIAPVSNIEEAVSSNDSVIHYIYNIKYSKGGTYLSSDKILNSLSKDYKREERSDGITEYRKVNYSDQVYQFYQSKLLYAFCEDSTLKMDNGYMVGDNKELFKELFHVKGILSDVVFVGIQVSPTDKNYSDDFDKSQGFTFFFRSGKCSQIKFESLEP